MSEEQLNSFLEKVKSVFSLQEKLKAAVSTEASIKNTEVEGFLITADDIH